MFLPKTDFKDNDWNKPLQWKKSEFFLRPAYLPAFEMNISISYLAMIITFELLGLIGYESDSEGH